MRNTLDRYNPPPEEQKYNDEYLGHLHGSAEHDWRTCKWCWDLRKKMLAKRRRRMKGMKGKTRKGSRR